MFRASSTSCTNRLCRGYRVLTEKVRYTRNDAAAQEQIDVVGELLDALNLMARAGIGDIPEVRTAERDLIEHLVRTWQDKATACGRSAGARSITPIRK